MDANELRALAVQLEASYYGEPARNAAAYLRAQADAQAEPHHAMLDSHRRLVEQAIQSAEHPSGMSTHDGKARIDASVLRRMLSIIDMAAILAHVEALVAENERLRDLLRVEQALALRQDPFRCYDIECEWFGRPVRAGDCQCHHLQATTHRANVRDALAKKEQR